MLNGYQNETLPMRATLAPVYFLLLFWLRYFALNGNRTRTYTMGDWRAGRAGPNKHQLVHAKRPRKRVWVLCVRTHVRATNGHLCYNYNSKLDQQKPIQFECRDNRRLGISAIDCIVNANASLSARYSRTMNPNKWAYQEELWSILFIAAITTSDQRYSQPPSAISIHSERPCSSSARFHVIHTHTQAAAYILQVSRMWTFWMGPESWAAERVTELLLTDTNWIHRKIIARQAMCK